MSLVESWCPLSDGRRVQRLDDLTLQWCARDEPPLQPPSEAFLPVCLYECPENFSTVEYFDNLSSQHVGRTMVYAEVLSSTTHVVSGLRAHGAGVIARRQTAALGRAGNRWITPPGQAALSLQVWRRVSATLPLAQHAAALAAATAVRDLPGYEPLDIRIKWPNDIYYGREVKIGGTITKANCIGDDVIVEIGTGVNISNSVPTTCVNDIISEYNKSHGTSLAPISIEKFLARYCSQLEKLLEMLDDESRVDAFLELYYKYWLHDGEEIKVKSSEDGSPVQGTISGLDSSGWLLVKTPAGEIRVAPDGNTFDIMSGLIAPKF